MRNKIIHIDFTKNKNRNKKQTFFSLLKGFLKRLFSSTHKRSHSDKDRKIIYYNKDIS
jgi:hypothetical protein